MITVILLLIALSYLVILGSGYLLYRNDAVCRFRVGLVNRIHELIRADGYPDDSDWRYDMFHAVSYEDMLYVYFWKPLKAESFYEDTSFLYGKDDDRRRDK